MPDLKTTLKLVRNLLEKRHARRKQGCFVVEGPHLVEEAANLLKFVIYCENLPLVKKLEESGIPGYKISRKQFADLSQVESHQGILGVVKMLDWQFQNLLKEEKTLVVFCIEVQDPGNLGTIVRSADAFGASGVILSKGTVDLYNPKVVRSTMGSLFHLPIISVESIEETIKHFREKNVKILATAANADKAVNEVSLKGPLVVLIGNEGAGLPKETLALADEIVKVPMLGKAESLNVGVCAAVILYEALRQRSLN
ncbi:MAG: 23S rRNA (guanosine(2251)-2'-O)-methyltransferase RlmB [Candidatus Margulisiibacteriota bacterium]